jgi:hypothetical protein
LEGRDKTREGEQNHWSIVVEFHQKTQEGEQNDSPYLKKREVAFEVAFFM